MTTTSRATQVAADPVLLDVVWSRLISLLNEQALALQRTAFSPIVREAGDCSVGFFGVDGRMIAQAVSGTPGHVLALPDCVKYLVSVHPPSGLRPGDVIITNDPYRNCGHQNDITVVTPVFRQGSAVALYGSTCHVPDIGGIRQGMMHAADVFEEGLLMPAMKLYREGVLNDDLIQLLRANVRQPNECVGDVNALVGTNDIGGKRVLEYMDELGVTDLEGIAEQIITRSERAMRAAIGEVPSGTYEHEVMIDGVVAEEPVKLVAKVIVDGGSIHVDYTGSSPKSRRAINVVLNYTHAYTYYAMKCAIAPDLPSNAGSLTPITVHAPEGSILNAKPPSPIGGRTRVGHFLPAVIFGALSKAIPGRVIAESVGMSGINANGIGRDGRRFNVGAGLTNGGMGARPNKDGMSATGWPHGARNVPIEISETQGPIVFLQHELRPDSAGPGKFRGGLGQIYSMRVLDCEPPYATRLSPHCIEFPARGSAGGRAGEKAKAATANGKPVAMRGINEFGTDDVITLWSGGGGGFYPAFERDPERVLADVVDGYVTAERARTDYGVVVDERGEIDRAATTKLRGSTAATEKGTKR